MDVKGYKQCHVYRICRLSHYIEEPGGSGPKHCEGKDSPPGPLSGHLWGPGVLLTASGTEPPASS